MKLPNGATVDSWAVGLHSIIARGTDNKWYVFGKSRHHHFASDDGHKSTTFVEMTMIPKTAEEIKKLRIVHFASGSHFSLFVTADGKLYGMGKEFMESIGIEAKRLTLIPLAENYLVKKAYCSTGRGRN